MNIPLLTNEKLYRDFYFKDLDYHKSRVKKMFKEIKRYGFSQASFIETNFVADYVVKFLPYRKDNFKFTLMNAQNIYAKSIGFNSWKELKDFCIFTFDVSKLRSDLITVIFENPFNNFADCPKLEEKYD